MEFKIREMFDDIQNSLLKGAAAAFITSLLVLIFAPKPTSVHIENGIPAEIYTIGRKGNPKAVYVSTKKRRLNLLPSMCMLAAAIGVYAAKKEIDESVPVSADKM